MSSKVGFGFIFLAQKCNLESKLFVTLHGKKIAVEYN